MINGERVRQARELCGLTQAELAARVGLKQSAIAHIEAGRFTPAGASLEAIALQTGFPPGFFRQEPGPDFPIGSLQFRAHASVTTRERTKAYRWAQTIYEIIARMALRVKPVPQSIPRLVADPVAAAQVTRSALGLSPDRPIQNLVHALEKSGAIVMLLPVPLEHIDAFSAWVGNEPRTPVIVAVAGKPGDRVRMSIAHDLGHLVIHHAVRGVLKLVEKEAFSFAAELLLPAAAMQQEMVRPVTLTSLAQMKARWGVSIQALIRRARELNIITPRQYTYLFEQMGARGWRTQEPVFIPAEKPRAVRKIAELLYGIPIDYRRVAESNCVAPRLVRELIEVYATQTELPGRAGGISKVIRPGRRT